jgi:hypothetical protein
MLTLEPELEKTLEALAKQEQISPNEIIKRLIKHYMKQKQESELLIDIANNLPEITCFKNQDPLEIQTAMRDEWN